MNTMYIQIPQRPKEGSWYPGEEIQVVTSYLTWVLKTEPVSFGKVAVLSHFSSPHILDFLSLTFNITFLYFDNISCSEGLFGINVSVFIVVSFHIINVCVFIYKNFFRLHIVGHFKVLMSTSAFKVLRSLMFNTVFNIDAFNT